MFVYDDFVADFRLKREGSWLETLPLSDCSTSRFYCASGSVFSIVLPRACEAIKVGQVWTEGGVTTTVLGREVHPLTPHMQAEFTWYLGDPSRPGVVYEYEPYNGLVALYRSVGDDFNFVDMARRGELAQFKQDRMSDWRIRIHYKRLTSFDPAGACRE